MNQILDMQKQILLLQRDTLNMTKMISDQADQITKLTQGGMSLLEAIKRHDDLIANLRKEIETLKLKPNKQVGF